MSCADDRPFEHLPGSEDEPPPGPNELRAIVARSGRHHRRAAAIGMAATLIVGGLAGYLITARSTTRTTTVAATGSSPSTTGATSGPVYLRGAPTTGTAIGSGTPGSSRYSLAFTRTAGGVTIRGLLTNFPQPAGAPTGGPVCRPVGPPSFQAELSTAKMVGDAPGLGTADRTKPISAVTGTVTGQPEGDPTAAVVAAAGPGVAKVRVVFTGGATDEMAPVQGWVTLAAGIPFDAAVSPTPIGTLTALDPSGKVLNTQAVTTETGAMRSFTADCGSPCPPLTTTTTAPASKGQASGQAPAIACTGPPFNAPAPGTPVPTLVAPLTAAPGAPGLSAPPTTSTPGPARP